MKSPSIPFPVDTLFIGMVMLGLALFFGWLVRDQSVHTPFEQLTPLPVYIQSAKYQVKYCHSSNGGRYICEEYYAVKAIHRTEKQAYNLRLMPLSRKHQLSRVGTVTRMPGDGLIGKNVNVWVDKNNHGLIYQAVVIDNRLLPPVNPAQLTDWLIYQRAPLDKTSGGRIILPYEVTKQQLQEQRNKEEPYLWAFRALDLFLALVGGYFLWRGFQEWREEKRWAQEMAKLH